MEPIWLRMKHDTRTRLSTKKKKKTTNMQFSKWGHPHAAKLIEDSLLTIPPAHLELSKQTARFSTTSNGKTFSNFPL